MTYPEVKYHSNSTSLETHPPLRLGGELRNWIACSTVAGLIQELPFARQMAHSLAVRGASCPRNTSTNHTASRLEGEFEGYADLGMQPESFFDEGYSAEKQVHCVKLGASCLWSQVLGLHWCPGCKSMATVAWFSWSTAVNILRR